jgi:hypothetical protein
MKADGNKGVINFNNIRTEMIRRDKLNVRANSKPSNDRNSKSPVLKRDNSMKVKLNPLNSKYTSSNKETISDTSPKKEINIPKIEDRKFSIIDLMVCESMYY